MLLSLSDDYHHFKFIFVCAAWVSLMSLPAIWAVLSNKHWFFRCAAVLIGALPILAMGAYDLTVVYGCYSAVVIVILTWAKRVRRRREGSLKQASSLWRFSSFQYSLKDLFLFTILSCILAAVVAALMRAEFQWSYMSYCSASLGMAAFVCSLVWLMFGKRRVTLRFIVFLVVWTAVATAWNQPNSSGFIIVLSGYLPFHGHRIKTSNNNWHGGCQSQG